MKQILLPCLFLSMTVTSLAQYADTSSHLLATDYLKKSKNQKTAGWVLLAGGAGLTTIGFIVGVTNAVDDLLEGDTGGSSGGPILMAAGLGSMLGSIPLFIAAGKNRRKAAASVSFKMENATNIFQCSFTSASYPAVAIHIRL